MDETPPDERLETHELHTRSADAYLDCCRGAVRTAAAYGDRLLAAYWPNRRVPTGFEASATDVEPDATPWPEADRVLAAPAADAPEVLDALYGDGAEFSALAVVRGDEPLVELYGDPGRLVATVTVPEDAPELADDLRAVAADHAAILTPVAVLAAWHDGERWYEVAAGSLYVTSEDPGDGDWVERRTSASQTGHDLVGLRRVSIDRDERRIDLEWAEVDRMNAIERYFGPVVDRLAGDPPAELAFGDAATFRTAANGLLAGVGDERRV